MAKRAPYKQYQTEPFQISRAKIEEFVRCPRCFVLEAKHGLKKPSSPPFTINTAVDTQLKKEFDIHREAGTVHPVVAAAGLNLVPFKHPKMDEWRGNFKGIRHTTDDFLITGAVDDIWVNEAGELVVVDYKATSRAEAVTELGEGGFYDGYRRQMEIYQWLLRQNGFNVASTGYWLYETATKKADTFDGVLHFEAALIAYVGNTDWIESTLNQMKDALDDVELPWSGDDCDLCRYALERNRVLVQFEDNDELPPKCHDCGNVMSRTIYGMPAGDPGPGFVLMGCLMPEKPVNWLCEHCRGDED